ncbi:MAG: DUF3617 domain-containing protein [Rhizobacter sp.]
MNLKLLAALSACLALGAPLSALAQTQLKPGLWEQVGTVKSQSGQVEKAMAEAQAQIAKLPPEQRRQIEQMMAERGVGIGNGATTVRLCLTAADVAQGNIPVQSGDCTQKVLSRDGGTTKVAFTCQTDPPVSGEGEVRVISPTSNLMTATVLTQINGQPEKLDTTQKGTWLGDDCGSIKPLSR